jgi:tRNA-splicing ligase RtcB
LTQLGTLGGGNHFVEVCLDDDDGVWLVLHSGSRGIGNQLAQKHIKIAKAHFDKYYITLDDPNLAYLVEDTPEFDAYIKDLNWSQKWAKENRSTMLSAALHEVNHFMGRTVKVMQGVNCHHNYTALENHGGKNLYITRKGAISARKGEMGIIPGSMGTHSYIVKGLGDKSSYTSAPHGAGRAMSRKAAREQFTIEDFKDKMKGKVWLEESANKLLDEHPDSYKDIHKVMRDSADLVEIVYELTQVLNYKGT